MATAFGAFFLHERLTAREGIGGFFIAAGALILALEMNSLEDLARRETSG
jgi:drug/metabolite transporter (DMT)-like permease